MIPWFLRSPLLHCDPFGLRSVAFCASVPEISLLALPPFVSPSVHRRLPRSLFGPRSDFRLSVSAALHVSSDARQLLSGTSSFVLLSLQFEGCVSISSIFLLCKLQATAYKTTPGFDSTFRIVFFPTLPNNKHDFLLNTPGTQSQQYFICFPTHKKTKTTSHLKRFSDF